LSIVESAHAMLAVKYPEFEVIIVDDGSTDATFERLQAAFDLVEVERVIPNDVPTMGVVRSVHAPADGGPLLVIRKDNAGRRADPVVEAGGLDLETLGEDAELVTRIQRMTSEQGRDFRVAFVAEPVCWTEVPHSGGNLGRQRRRWSQGLAEILWKHRRMMLNP